MATPLVIKIANTLQQELNAADALLSLLQQEATALSERDLPRLAEIIEAKSQQLTLLDQASAIRQQILEEQKVPKSELQWRQLLDKCRDPRLVADWYRLEGLIKACKKENQINGKLLSRSQRTLDRLNQILRGQAPQSGLYNQKGGHSKGSKHLTYAQA